MNYVIGFLLSALIAGLAYLKKSLTLSGMITAILLGTFVYAWGKPISFMLLMVFFISSSLITIKEVNEKKGRNYIQVLCNASLAFIFSALYHFFDNPIYLVACAASIAVSNSDTWASEIGKKTKGRTFSILSFKPIDKGLSGGVSLLGMAASLLGSLVIGICFYIGVLLMFDDFEYLFMFSMLIFGFGFLGNIIDSYLGILLQAKYLNHIKGIIVEKQNSLKEFKLISGFKVMTNDAVNFMSGLLTSVLLIILMF